MENKDIENKIIEVFENKFQFHPQKLTESQKTESLLKPDIGFKAVDLFVLYMELEKALDITFDEQDVVENRFDVYNNILASVSRHLLEKRA